MKADMKKKIFFIILGIIFLPIIINYVLMLPTPFNFPIIGSNVDWLSFWGTYIGGIIGASASFLILYLTLLHNKNEAKIERKHNELLQLKKDLSERLSDVNFMPLHIDASQEINVQHEISRLNMLYEIYGQKCCTAKFLYENDNSELAKLFYKAYYNFTFHFGLETNKLKDILTNEENKDKLKHLIEEYNNKLLMNQCFHSTSVNETALKFYEFKEKEYRSFEKKLI